MRTKNRKTNWFFKLNFSEKSYEAKTLPASDRTFLYLHVVSKVSNVCFGKDIKLAWDSNEIDSIKFYLHRLDWPRENIGGMFLLGEVPAMNNEQGIAGRGEFIWNAQQAVPYIKDGASFNVIGWATSSKGEHQVYVETEETFVLSACQG